MRKNANIELQGFYTCKVTNKVVTVQILASSPQGGWEALNTATGKKIHIKGPERLIKKVPAPKSKDSKPATSKKKVVKKTPSKKSEQTKTAKSSNNKLSLLDAAVEVLKKQSPLTCRQLIERMTEAELWKSETGKTPANTLHAALSKEIRVKGDESRFEKVDRGQFGLKAEK